MIVQDAILKVEYKGYPKGTKGFIVDQTIDSGYSCYVFVVDDSVLKHYFSRFNTITLQDIIDIHTDDYPCVNYGYLNYLDELQFNYLKPLYSEVITKEQLLHDKTRVLQELKEIELLLK